MAGTIKIEDIGQEAESALKKKLEKVRYDIQSSEMRLKALREEEKELTIKLKSFAKKERCQPCKGKGVVERRDWQSGYDCLTPCENCNGTGQWTEEI